MKKILYRIFAISILLSCGVCLSAQTTPEPYLTIDDMPDLVQCLPAPPAPGSAEFALDVQRYEWGKKQRLDPEQAAIIEKCKVQRDVLYVSMIVSENADRITDIYRTEAGLK